MNIHHFRKRTSFFASLFFALLVPASLASAAFSDISGTTYENAVSFVADEGIVNGYPDGTFQPNKILNRAELLKILIEARNAFIPEGSRYSPIDISTSSDNCFSDVKGSDWYVPYVCTAKAYEFVSGYKDGTFKPAQNVNFAEALKMFETVFDLHHLNGRSRVESDPWYKEYVDVASERNMIPLDISRFDVSLTRGQMADIVTRMFKESDGTLNDYLTESFGEGGTAVMTYDIIADRANASTLPMTTLPDITIDTFSTDIPVAKEMNFAPAYEEEDLNVTAAGNYDAVKSFLGVTLTNDEINFLNENKFLLIPKSETKYGDSMAAHDEMLSIFDDIGGDYEPIDRDPENARLVTPDIVLHAFHKFFENSLEELERNELGTELRSFTNKLHGKAIECMKTSKGEVAVRCEMIAAQLTVPAILIENADWEIPPTFWDPVEEDAWKARDNAVDTIANAKSMLGEYRDDFSPEVYTMIEAELESIYDGSEVGTSPLFIQYYEDLKTDYTQYTPRSHYTKSSALRAYFRTMMYYGRSTYFFYHTDLGVKDTLLLSYLMSDPAITDSWTTIMEITGFYAGEADDIVIPVWNDYVEKILGSRIVSPVLILDSGAVSTLKSNLSSLPMPRILSDIIETEQIGEMTKEDLLNATKGFRIFGQRFTFDAWVLNDLTAGSESTDVKLPSTPSALFVNAAFGDETAKGFISTYLKDEFSFSQTQVNDFFTKLDKKIDDIAKVTDKDWLRSIGSAWLEVIGTLTETYGEGYPLYMQSAVFPLRQIQSFLGSYTELKHDTVLYAKQSYAELGAGWNEGDIPPVVKGFVEPDMEFWYRLQRLVSFTKKGFEEHELLTDQIYRLVNFEDAVNLYTRIAEKELKNETVSAEDYESLRTTDLEFMAEPMGEMSGGFIMDEDLKRSGLITDIHTDALLGQILYEANGVPYIMIALVANESSPRLVVGVVFNHYELTGPLTSRYTDEEWRAKAYDGEGTMPERSFFYEDLLLE